jgi:CRISPR-associated protein Csx14
MTQSQPTFSVNVDVTNPGQFFACCGLLELAHRLWPGAEGWFEANAFRVRTHEQAGDPLTALVQELGKAQVQDCGDGVEKAIRPLNLRPFGITLDWWVDQTGKRTALKLWAGQQTSLGIVETLRDAAAELVGRPLHQMLDAAQPLTGRFGLDPRSAWNALDVGFSPNEQGMEVATFAAVELLGAVGLQRFRPVEDARDAFRYAAWTVPLPPPVARAASAGVIRAGEVQQYRFRIAIRGSYKGFDFATPIQEIEHEQGTGQVGSVRRVAER